ncbi:hypothetical protein GQ600_2900 [Phytophthora cactorum]|nr:hypothetical protein GQ600_2900 [Phytophthora cactorum]
MARTFAGRLEIKGSYGPVERLHVSYAGKTKKDVRCVDFFVGEAELLAYLDRIALEEMKKAATARHKAKAAANRPTIQSGQPQIGMSNSQGDGGPLNPNADTADTACANEQSSNAAASSSQDPAVLRIWSRKLVMKTLR